MLRNSQDGEPISVTYRLTFKAGTCLFSISDGATVLPEHFSIEMADDLGYRICRTYASQLGAALTFAPLQTGGVAFNLAFAP